MCRPHDPKPPRTLWKSTARRGAAALLSIGCGVTHLCGAENLPVTPSVFGVSEWGHTSAQVCRACHADHYEMWSHSMHAMALEDPMFKVSFLQAQASEGVQIRNYCLTCHAPLSIDNKDFSLSSDLTREGITCDFCHTVTGLHLGRKPSPYDNKTGATKLGPLKAAATPAHHSRTSTLFSKSEFCAGCHELVNEHGVLVMGTYSEWRNSPYPDEGVQCQNCHMSLTLHPTAITLDGDTLENLAYDHSFQGGHSQINLKHAASIELNVQTANHTADIEVFITNKESGHKLPTGTPARRVMLKVKVLDQNGQLLAQPTRFYRKVLVDRDGTILEGNSNHILKSVRIFSDNRIAPRETRREAFLVDLPETTISISVTAELLYEFETPVMFTQLIQTEMATIQKSLTVKYQPAATVSPRRNYTRIWFLVILLIASTAALYALIRHRKATS